MYEAFYGFRDSPFRLTPDPDYLFLSANHQEALGHLLFGVNEGSGVVVITGEIGAGKTTLLRTLVRSLDAQTTVAYIFNPVLSPLELLQTINADLGLPATSASKKELTDELNRFLLSQQAGGRRTVVIIDEAQDLEPAVLEQLRLLSNLETERAKLLQIVLVGQPELAGTLARPDLAQLDQRVTLRWHLKPLPADDTGTYIRHRLQIAAGGRTPVIFTPGAVRLVYNFSHGVPRLINVLCHRALLIAYTREERQISTAVIRQAIKELRRHARETHPSLAHRFFTLKTAVIGSLLLALGTLSVMAATRGWLPQKWVAALTFHEQAQQKTPTVSAQAQDNTSPSKQNGAPAEQATTPSPPPDPQSVSKPTSSPALPESSSQPKITNGSPSAPSLAAVEKTQTEKDSITAEEFLQNLRQMTMVDSAVRATQGLLRTWKVEGLRNNEWQRGALDLNAIARARQLEYLPVNGSLNLLSLLDLPMIMELIIPGIPDTRFVLLLGLSGDQCRVLLDREREIPLRTLGENWFGKGYLFWKDFEDVGGNLMVGSVGQNVQRLHALLVKAQGPNEENLSFAGRETVFNRQTEVAVARFQRTKRLTPDGVVGPLTMILLYNTLPTYIHPRLTGVIDPSIGEHLAEKTGGTAARVTGEGVGSEHEHNS